MENVTLYFASQNSIQTYFLITHNNTFTVLSYLSLAYQVYSTLIFKSCVG